LDETEQRKATQYRYNENKGYHYVKEESETSRKGRRKNLQGAPYFEMRGRDEEEEAIGSSEVNNGVIRGRGSGGEKLGPSVGDIHGAPAGS
jgi:hypothetical protein